MFGEELQKTTSCQGYGLKLRPGKNRGCDGLVLHSRTASVPSCACGLADAEWSGAGGCIDAASWLRVTLASPFSRGNSWEQLVRCNDKPQQDAAIHQRTLLVQTIAEVSTAERRTA
jgi:hypothetical protein